MQGQSKSRAGVVGGGVEADGQQLIWQADRSLGKVDDREVHNERERVEEGAALGVVLRFGGDCRHVQNRVEVDKPFQVAIAVCQMAKLWVLQFYYDCLDKFLDRRDFQLIQIDTDSLYFGLSCDSVEEAVSPEMLEEL